MLMQNHRFGLTYVIPLFLICMLLLAGFVWWMGGSPLGRAPQSTDAMQGVVPSEGAGEASPITCVVIDPGHGGEDGGAVSAHGLVEKDVNLAVALALRDLYEAAGIPVIMTRIEDVLLYDRNVDFQGRKKVLDLAARRMIAEKTAGGVFISIHMNAFPAPQYSGMQVWYGLGDPRSSAIAEGIQAASTLLMPTNHRRTKAAGSQIYLLDRIKTPAVLVECGFLSNPGEAELLSREDYGYALATVIFGATVPYITAPS